MRSSWGFTLIELMVAVVIGAVLFGAGMAAYRGIGERQTVKQAGASFQANLRLFQEKAGASEKPTVCGLNDTFKGYRVRYIDESSYLASPVCQIALPEGRTFTLPEKVEFINPFEPNEIIFNVLKSEVTGAQSITLGTDSFRYQVIIEAGGVIRGGML